MGFLKLWLFGLGCYTAGACIVGIGAGPLWTFILGFLFGVWMYTFVRIKSVKPQRGVQPPEAWPRR